MEVDQLAPIVVFAYKRLDTLRRTIHALSQNKLAENSVLIVFSDGFRDSRDEKGVMEVREYLNQITGFKELRIIESPHNKGLANSIIIGVSQVLEEYGQIIVVEDDVVTSPNFLLFMNQGLNVYRTNDKLFSISGFTIPVKSTSKSDVYFTKRSNSSVWGSWKNRWETIDWTVSDYDQFKADRTRRKQFNRMGSDMCSMLDRQKAGKLNSWAIRWCYHQFKYDLLTAYPVVSKAVNIGFDSNGASNTTERFSRFNTVLDTELKEVFHFPNQPEINEEILKQFLKPYSLFQRVKYKLINKVAR